MIAMTLVGILSLLPPGVAGPGGLDLSWHTIDGGGGLSTATGLTLSGTVGQPERGAPRTGGGLTLIDGHWTPGFCRADTNNDNATDVNDLVNVIILWGTNGQDPGLPGVNADITAAFGGLPDGVVDVNDLNEVILGWGPCGL